MFKFRTKSKTPASKTSSNALRVEQLEDRLMLSTVDVFAAGETGRESFFLLLDGEVVETVDAVGGDFENRDFQKFSFQFDQDVTADQISIEFFNDFVDADGNDNNLFVDKIAIDGQEFETEAPTTFHTGLVSGDQVLDAGFLETEVLNINGKVTFFARGTPPVATPVATGTRIRIDATGQTGEENLQLQIDDQVVANFRFDEAGVEQAFFFSSDEVIDPSRVKIAFTNDAVDPVTGADRNVFVRAYQLIDRSTGERQLLHTLDPRVFSNNSFVVAEDSSRAGYGLGGALTSNGFITFDDSATTIRVDTIGSTGQEVFEVLVDGRVVSTLLANTHATEQFVEVPGDIDLSRVQIRFINDLSLPDIGFDRNLTVLGFQTINRTTGDRMIARGTDANVFSTGVFNDADGLQDGFGRGRTLTNNGFFQFQPSHV